MSNESEVAETFNNFFVTITDSLGIVENEDIVLPSEDISDPIDRISCRFSRHPSIKKIRSLNVNIGSFSFEKVSVQNMKNKVDGLNPSKSTTFRTISLLASPHVVVNFGFCQRNFGNFGSIKRSKGKADREKGGLEVGARCAAVSREIKVINIKFQTNKIRKPATKSDSGRLLRHFELAGHHGFMEDVKVQVIDRIFGESRVREGFWQFKLDSFAPKGLHVRLVDS